MKLIKIFIQTLFLFSYFWWQEILYFYILSEFFPQPKPSYANIDAIHYTIEIKLLVKRKEIAAKVNILFNPIKNRKFIVIDFADGFNVTKLKLNNNDVEYEYRNEKISLISDKEILDSSIIDIEYYGKPNQKKNLGLIFGNYEGEDLVYTINEASEARSWLPCSDSPSDKVILDIKITNDEKFISLSNGNLIDSSSQNGLKTYHWKSNYPITTYNIAITSGILKRHIVPDKQLKIIYYVPDNIASKAARDFSNLQYLIKKNVSYFGEYPFINEKIGFTINLWEYGAVENQTLISIGQKFIKGDNSNLSLIHHELTHSWWGNSASIKSWKDIWLTEGLSRYSEILLAKDYFKNDIQNYYKLLDIFSSISFDSPLYNPRGFIFENFIYDKSARVLLMLSEEIGDSLFTEILKKFHNKFKYGNFSTNDFKKFIENETKRNFDDFFDQWIYKGVGLPVIQYSYRIDYYEKKSIVTITLEQIQNDFKKYNLKIPIVFSGIDENKSEKLIQIKNFDANYRMNSRKMKIVQVIDSKINSVLINPERKILARFIRKD